MDVHAARLAEPPRTRLTETWRGHEDRRSGFVPDDFEVVALAHGRLVDVATEDEVGAGRRERVEDVLPARDGALVRRTPWSTHEVVVEDGDA